MPSRTKGIMQFPAAHSKFPTNDNATKASKDPDVKTYITRFYDDEWKLHNIQRNDSTWKDPEYALTIQSIFEGSMLSPFIASLQENGIDTFLIDGGHRTRAILRFMDDEFPVKIWRTDETSLYSELEERDRKKFLSTEINVITWNKLTKLDEETLFFRVNIGLCLSGGEAVNAYHTIPMCVLARKLAEKYDDVLHETINRAVLKKNERHDASSWMFLLLSNFHHHNLIRGENYGKSMFEEQKKDCENFRGVEIDEEYLTQKIDFLMSILSTKTVTKKLPTYILPTIQAIMLAPSAPAVFPQVPSAQSINHFLFDMLETDTDITPDPLVIKWNGYSRKVKSNPGEPVYCFTRADIYLRWVALTPFKKS